ncbi:hypothetical protein PQ469_12035 [Mucilaginibacter sp. KACC 22773]|uniref:hypothetical protein n=1 Tax=Mucilaginibacter sp. KACC 22773 TaxID=3025671 RepID=UPI002366BE08|nr:hypothetical protein [Mucilaginibacter sp. KACC 22773]WDF80736.1 hypothetical protein PQ469_12035 [Mucilaginibacter sp. KACC 22773]
MKRCILFLIQCLPFLVNAQSTATVAITFQNAKYTKIEKHSFFKFKKPDNFVLKKIDNEHYKLDYLDSKPGVLYVNKRPILITPGDNVKLTYKLIIWDDENFKDTISALGKNAKNYTYSNFLNTRLVKGDSFPDLRNVKYQNDPEALYTALVNAYAFRLTYYNAPLKVYGYDKSFSDYVKRINNIEFLSHALSLETELGEQHKKQHPVFAKKVREAFFNTSFIAADTNYTYRMEETFYAYFWHLAHAEFAPLNSRKNFDGLLTFIINYPNSFVRDYFLSFLIIDYNDSWNKFRPQSIMAVVQAIKNPSLKELLRNYDY